MNGVTGKVHDLARMMHEVYEDAAIKTGWQTQENCRVDFDKLPEANKQTMYILASAVLLRFKQHFES